MKLIATLLFFLALSAGLCLPAQAALAATSDAPEDGFGSPAVMFILIMAAVFLLAAAFLVTLVVFILFGLGVAFTSSIYALIRRRWSALLRAFVVQMFALWGTVLCAAILLLADWYWNINWGWQADLIVGGAVGLLLGIFFGLAVNAIISRIWRWARLRRDPKLDPADEAKHKK